MPEEGNIENTEGANMTTPERPQGEGPLSQAEAEIFGSADAFSERWTRLHGLPDVIEADPRQGIARSFSPAEVFSDIAETGLSDQPAWYRASLAIEASSDKNFRRAARTGLLRLLALDHTMRAGRIDSVANILKSEFGATPQGIAQWLMVDQETRRSLALMFRLQGYEVADEPGIHDQIMGLGTEGKLSAAGHKFSEYLEIKPDQVRLYLHAVQGAVGTDPGVVRLAYAIFRCLGFPHENYKFAEELIRKYRYNDRKRKGDLDPSEVGPFLDQPEDSTSNQATKEGRLTKILRSGGIIGLTQELNHLPGEKLGRWWADLNLLLDMMDAVSDIRAALGEAAGLPFQQRHQAIVKAMGVPMAKRLLSEETIKRLQDPGKIESTREAVPSQLAQEKAALRKIFSDLTGGSRRKKEK